MSEVKLNLVDAQNILSGAIHGSVVDSCVAALSAEPETIGELGAALARYIRPEDGVSPFSFFRSSSELDSEPWDAGLVIVDLAARIVAIESSYSEPQPEGKVHYHDGSKATEISVPYRLPGDWLFVNSIDAYRWSCDRRVEQRRANLPFDTRAILYGRALLEFIVTSGSGLSEKTSDGPKEDDAPQEALANEVSRIHADWLMTPREDLRGRSPREVLLEKRELIDYDLETRCWQWTMLGEGPPCLASDSFAYRFGGFGTHEWVVYYDLLRHLLFSMAELDCRDLEKAINRLERIKTDWLENRASEYEGKVPAVIIENERKRLPQAMSPKELIIDDDCEICRMSALEAEMGFGPGFWHLDGSHMDDGFAFSTCVSIEEWEAENRQREAFNREFNRSWAEREQRIALGEPVDDEFDLDWVEAQSDSG